MRAAETYGRDAPDLQDGIWVELRLQLGVVPVLFSPAKINLFLAITGRRADGFHDLVSVVAPLDFGDSNFLKIMLEGPESIESEAFARANATGSPRVLA